MLAKPVAGVQGPTFRALDPWLPGNPGHGRTHQLLSDGERTRLAVISSVVRFKKGAEICHEGDDADAVFNIISGVVKAYTQGPGHDELVSAFLFSEDLFGLAREGHYVNSTKAVTPVTAYRIPIAALGANSQPTQPLSFTSSPSCVMS
jgi:CRP-like cAMP-binding protein